MTKYVVSGYIGFDNFGDELIADVLAEKLKKNGAEKITFISSNPSRTAEIHKVDSCGMFNFLPVLLKSDVLISGGGSLLQDVTSLKSLLYYLGVIFSALIFGKKVEIFSQGIGPINSSFGRFLTKFALKKAEKITVRDEKSRDLLANWGITAELVDDPAFELEIPKIEKTESVGVQLRSFRGVDERFLERLSDKIAEKFFDREIIVFSLQDSADLDICNKFNEILLKKNLKSSVVSNLSIKDAIDKLVSLKYLISMRFHSNVIGIRAGVKTLAINYDPKVEKLAQKYDIPFINLKQENISDEFEKLIV